MTIILLLALSACSGDDAGNTTNANPNPPPPNPPPPNGAPSISGTPPASVVQDVPYSFTPTASDPDGDTLSFSITNPPRWAFFNGNNGNLSGTPTAMDLGSHPGISITVTDGQADATLGPFDIEVVPVALGSATLSWTPPTENADGSQLNDLAGYRVRWGTQTGSHPNMIEVRNPGIASYVVNNLAPGRYFFVVSAIDMSDNESPPSNEAIADVP